jgi:phage baseplate assembly protein W
MNGQLDFPYRFDDSGRTGAASRAGHVRDLIEQVLLTAPTERVMRPDFGAGLLALVFEPNSSALAAATQLLVQGALHQHLGHLIGVQGVDVVNDDGALRVAVRYVLLSDRSTHTASIAAPGAPA